MKPTMLLIAEKPSERRDYEKAYFNHQSEIPYHIIFTELRGHVDQIPPQKIEGGWSFDNALYIPEGFKKWNFTTDGVIDPKDSPFIPSKDGKAIVENIIGLLEDNHIDYIGIGTDADIEGSFLANAFLSMLPVKFQEIPRLRLFIDDQSEQSVVKGLQHMHQQDEKMANGLVSYNDYANSGVLRGQINYVMGITMTRALTVKTKSKAPVKVGYVKAPILQIVNQRYQQYINFKSEPFYMIKASFKHANGTYTGTLIDRNHQQMKYTDKAKAQQICQLITNEGVIADKQVKHVVTQAPLFYKLTKLQGVMNAKYGMPLSKSLAVAQALYEKKKLLTYPRTESEVVGDGQVADFSAILQMITCIPQLKKYAEKAISLNRINAVARNKRFVNQKKVVSHPAIMLNTHEVTQFNWDELSKDEQHLIYEVALNNLLPFLEPKESENTTVITSVKTTLPNRPAMFISRGVHVMNKGWSELVTNKQSDDEQSLPAMQLNDPVQATVGIKADQTKPLPLYTIKTLMDNLDSLNHLESMLSTKDDRNVLKDFSGIGTPATRGAIINELLANGTLKEATKSDKVRTKSLIPTQDGQQLASSLTKLGVLQLNDVVNFELDLTAIQQGKMLPAAFQNKYFEQANEQLQRIINTDLPDISLGKAKAAPTHKVTKLICPVCGKHHIIETNKGFMCEGLKVAKDENGKVEKDQLGHIIFTGCSFLISKKPFNMQRQQLTVTALKQILAGELSKTYTFHSTKKNKNYRAQIKWNNESKQFELVLPQRDVIDLVCPLCGGKIIESDKSFHCEHVKVNKKGSKTTITGCQFLINKNPYNMQQPLTADDLKTLISSGELANCHFYSTKKKRAYTANLHYDQQQNKLSLSFDN